MINCLGIDESFCLKACVSGSTVVDCLNHISVALGSMKLFTRNESCLSSATTEGANDPIEDLSELFELVRTESPSDEDTDSDEKGEGEGQEGDDGETGDEENGETSTAFTQVRLLGARQRWDPLMTRSSTFRGALDQAIEPYRFLLKQIRTRGARCNTVPV